MSDIVFCLIISFGIAFLSIPAIIKIAEKKRLYDEPDERKIHVNSITSLGGIGIFAGFILSCLIIISFSNAPEFQYFMASAVIIFFLGLKDDLLALPPLKKLAGQFFAAFLIVEKGDLQIRNMYGFLGIHELSYVNSYLFTLFTIIVIINSFNLIDGVDGLAGALGLIATTILGIYFLEMDLFEYAIFAFSLGGSLIAFLYFNFHPAKIFMGDTGSLTIGLICSILIIKFINVAPGQPSFPIASAPALGFSILIIPLLDTLRVFTVRIIRGKSPFRPDRHHIHHKMLDKGFNEKSITLSLSAISITTIALVFIGQNLGSTFLIALMIAGYFSFIIILSRIPHKIRAPKTQMPLQSIQVKWVEKAEIAEEAIAE